MSFFERRFDQLNEKQQYAFSLLLEQQDPVIIDWIWEKLSPPRNDIGEIVMMIRRDAGIHKNLIR